MNRLKLKLKRAALKSAAAAAGADPDAQARKTIKIASVEDYCSEIYMFLVDNAVQRVVLLIG